MKLGLIAVAFSGALLAAEATVTFNKDVLPILQKNCQSCHRPGEVAPFSLLTYAEARPWAKAMKAAVAMQKMPPWFVEPQYDHRFSNIARLTQDEIKTISTWADNGAVEGEAKDKPAPRTFVSGWNLKPDLVVEMPAEFSVPASGAIEYQYMKVKGNFPEDVWIEAGEMRPGNPKVVHHGEVWVLPPDSKWMAGAEYGVSYPMSKYPKNPSDDNDVIGKFNPGVGAQIFKIGDSAKFVPKGSDLVFEIHYTAVGKATTDRTTAGFTLAKGEHKTRYFMSYGPTASNLVIPPNDANAEVVSELTSLEPMRLVYVQPHMHLRGKDFELRAVYPTGERETIFKARWDFNWQLGYQLAKPLSLPVGTRLIGISHFDNSANNKFNPDPSNEVVWGLQNWEEMSNCFMGLLIDSKTDPKKLFKRSGVSLLKTTRGVGGPTLAQVQ